MEMFATAWELMKYDTEMRSEKTQLEYGTDRLVQGRVTTNLQFHKNIVSVKHNHESTIKQGLPVVKWYSAVNGI